MDRKTDPDPQRSALLPVHAQRQIGLLYQSSHPLDRKPTRRKNDQVSLLKRGAIWWTYFYVDGIRRQFSTGTTNRRKAERIEAQLKEEINDQRFGLVEA